MAELSRRSLLLLRYGWAAVAVVAAGTVGGCTASRSASVVDALPRAQTAEMVRDAQSYQAIVAPFDDAVQRFAAESRALPEGASVGSFVATSEPLAETIATIDRGLREVVWPRSAAQDIRAELDADRGLRTDLKGTADVTLILTLWRSQIISAARKAGRQQQRVSIDLGLVRSQ